MRNDWLLNLAPLLLAFGPMTVYYAYCWWKGKTPVNPYAGLSHKVETPWDKLDFEPPAQRGDDFGMLDAARSFSDMAAYEHIMRLEERKRLEAAAEARAQALAAGRDPEIEALLEQLYRGYLGWIEAQLATDESIDAMQ